MARRGDIAALGALAALGAGILENKRNKDKVPVESLESAGKKKSTEETDYGPDYAREVARASRGPTASLEGKATPTKTQAPAKAEAKPASQGYTRGKEQMSDYQMRQARDLKKGTTRGRPAEGAPRTTTSARAEAPSGDLASQIPGSSPAGWQGGSGERVDSTELGRNLSAATMGRGPTALSQVGNLAADVAATSRAARAARAAQAAKEAEREAVTNPLQWMAGQRGELGRRAMSEADTTGGAIGYKRGGSAKKSESSTAAKGWGKARGARQAKYY